MTNPETGNPHTLEPGTLSGFKRPELCSFSGCVEVAQTEDGGVAVRDSKLGEGSPVLNFTPEEWGAFLGAVIVGELRCDVEIPEPYASIIQPAGQQQSSQQ